MGMREPWWLFCGDQAFAEACVQQVFAQSQRVSERATLLHWLSRLGSWELLEQLLHTAPELLAEEAARAALLHLRQQQNHPNPWLALLPEAEHSAFLHTWCPRWRQGAPLAVQLCGGLGDQLEALALLGQPAWRQRLELVLPEASRPALEPLLQRVAAEQALPRCRFSPAAAAWPWLSWPAMRAVLANVGEQPIPRQHWAQKGRGWARPRLLVCWRSKQETGELLWAHLRSLPMATIEHLYRWLLPWAAGRGWEVLDLSRYSPGEQWRLQQLPAAAQLQLRAGSIRSLADTADLVASARLTISVDTALVHLAHALGAPRWLLLHRHPDARWRLRLQQDGASDLTQLKVLQQTRQGEWWDVLQQLRRALEA